MSEGKQAKIIVEYHEGPRLTLRYAQGVNVNYQLGVVEVAKPREYPTGMVLIPYMAPNSVKYLVIEEEQIQEVRATLVKP